MMAGESKNKRKKDGVSEWANMLRCQFNKKQLQVGLANVSQISGAEGHPCVELRKLFPLHHIHRRRRDEVIGVLLAADGLLQSFVAKILHQAKIDRNILQSTGIEFYTWYQNYSILVVSTLYPPGCDRSSSLAASSLLTPFKQIE